MMEDETEDKDDCKYKQTSRFWLYIMVITIFFQTCEMNDRTRRIEDKVNQIEVIMKSR